MKKISIYIIGCFALLAHLEAASGPTPSEIAEACYTEVIRTAFGSKPVVMDGEEVVSYYHNPISKGVMVCQAEARVLEPNSKQSILYCPNITSCQLVIIHNEKTKKTGMYSLDQFFNFTGIAETLDSYGPPEDLRVRVVANETYFNDMDENKEEKIKHAYGERTIDEHLLTIANLFQEQGITTIISKLTVNMQNSSDLFRFFSPAISEDLFLKSLKDPPSKLCVDRETGQLYWWSTFLVRKTISSTHSKPIFMDYYDKVVATKLQRVKEKAEERATKRSFYALNEME